MTVIALKYLKSTEDTYTSEMELGFLIKNL